MSTARRDRAIAESARRESLDRQEKRNRRGAIEGASGSLPKILVGGRKRQAQKTSGRVDVESLARSESAVTAAHDAYAEVKVDPVMYADLASPHVPTQALVAEARGFNVRYDSRWIFARDLDFAWRGPVRISLAGRNGSGKSTLLRAILGDDFALAKGSSRASSPSLRGTITRGTLPVLYVDQRSAILNDDESVLENVRSTSSLTETELRNGLAKFLFTGDRVFQNVSDLSGGERLRAALAKGFLGGTVPGLLVLDEPTNNLDLANVEFLENLLSQYQGALLVVSHDEVFLEKAGISEKLEL